MRRGQLRWETSRFLKVATLSHSQKPAISIASESSSSSHHHRVAKSLSFIIRNRVLSTFQRDRRELSIRFSSLLQTKKKKIPLFSRQFLPTFWPVLNCNDFCPVQILLSAFCVYLDHFKNSLMSEEFG